VSQWANTLDPQSPIFQLFFVRQRREGHLFGCSHRFVVDPQLLSFCESSRTRRRNKVQLRSINTGSTDSHFDSVSFSVRYELNGLLVVIHDVIYSTSTPSVATGPTHHAEHCVPYFSRALRLSALCVVTKTFCSHLRNVAIPCVTRWESSVVT
jgi:hypothetical protein